MDAQMCPPKKSLEDMNCKITTYLPRQKHPIPGIWKAEDWIVYTNFLGIYLLRNSSVTIFLTWKPERDLKQSLFAFVAPYLQNHCHVAHSSGSNIL